MRHKTKGQIYNTLENIHMLHGICQNLNDYYYNYYNTSITYDKDYYIYNIEYSFAISLVEHTKCSLPNAL